MKLFSLSESQLGIYYAYIKNPQATEYNLPCVLKYSKAIDSKKLGDALKEVIGRHSIFNTKFIEENGDIWQYIDCNRDVHIEFLSLHENDMDGVLNNFVQPFDLFNDVLYRVKLIETEQALYFLLDVHHIITDGTSMILFLQEIDATYSGYCVKEEDATLLDFIENEKQILVSDEYTKAANYYQEKFEGLSMTRILSYDKDGFGNMAQQSTFVDAPQVDTFCKENGITPNLFFIACYSLALSIFSREEKVVFYSINHGRMNRRYRNSYGPFIKSFPVLAVIDSEMVLLDFIKSFKKEMMGAIRYDAYPFGHFCRDLHIKPEMSFAFQYNIGENITLGDEETVLKALPKGLTSQNMSVVVYLLNNQYEMRLEYNDNIYDEIIISKFLNVLSQLSCSMLKNPFKKLKEIDVISEDEKQSLLDIGFGGKADWSFDETFIDLFKKQVKLTPNSKAVVDLYGSLTYKELDQLSDIVAQNLLDLGVNIGDFIAILLDRKKEFMVCVIGVLKAGCAYLPLSTTYPSNRLEYMLHDSCSQILLTQKEVLEEVNIQKESIKIINVWSWIENSIIVLAETNFPKVTKDQLAYMIYTSGSTGKPKGVMISHRALISFVHVCLTMYQLTASDRIFCHSNFCFDASVEELFPILTCGGELHILADNLIREPEKIVDYIRSHNLTGGSFATQLGVEILSNYNLNLKYVSVGGEKLEKHIDSNARCFNLYGPTEFTVDATFFEIEKGVNYKSIPIGRPTIGSYAYVVDNYNRLLPQGCVGELCLSGPQIANGYWEQEEITDQKFVDNPFGSSALYQKMYRTGDLVRWNANNQLEYIGRGDNQIKLRGYRIELGEIESSINSISAINQAIVEVKKINGQEQICAYYTSNTDISEDEIREYLKQILPDYFIPSFYMQLTAFPLTPNGKIDRASLPVDTFVVYQEYIAPVTVEEKILSNIVQEILEIDRIGVSTNLFDLGLSSMQAMHMVAEAVKFNIEISVSNIYDYLNIRNILREKNARKYFWANEYIPGKPVLILTCGKPFFHPFYNGFFNRLKDRFSIFVFDSVTDFFMWKEKTDINLESLLDYYEKVIRDTFINIPIYAIGGYCMGSEIAMFLAERVKKNCHYAPKVLILDGYKERTKNEPVLIIKKEDVVTQLKSSVEVIQEYYRVVTYLIDTFPNLNYDGDVLICLAGKKTRKLLEELGEISDEVLLEKAFKEIDENKIKWQVSFPNAPYYELNTDHAEFFADYALNELETILRKHWNDIKWD